jgi:hypothetical protein
MIKLSRAELFELAGAFLIANTPASLYESLLSTSALARLREEVSSDELLVYFDFLTARTKRTAIVIALAYAAIIAFASKRVPLGGGDIDVSRLNWGNILLQTARARNPPTSATVIQLGNQPVVKSGSSPNSTLVIAQ